MVITGMAYTSPYSVYFLLPKEDFCVFVINKDNPIVTYNLALTKRDERKINLFLIEELSSVEKLIKTKINENKYIVFDIPEKLEKVKADIIDIKGNERDKYIKNYIDPKLLIDKIKNMQDGIHSVPKIDMHKGMDRLARVLSAKAKASNKGFKKTFEEVLKTLSKDVDLWIKKNKKKYKPALVLKLKKYCHKTAIMTIVDYIPFSAMHSIKYKGKRIIISKQTVKEIEQFSRSFAGDLAVQAYHDMTLYKTGFNKACSSVYADPNTVQQFVNLFKIDHSNKFEYNRYEDDEREDRISDSIRVKRENHVYIKPGYYSLKKLVLKSNICEDKKEVKKLIKNKAVKVKAKSKTKHHKKYYCIKTPTKIKVDGIVYNVRMKQEVLSNAC